VFLDGFLLLGYLVGLVILSPLYSLVLLPLLLMHGIIMSVSYRTLRTLAQRELGAKAGEQTFLVEALEAMVALKAGGVEGQAVRRWEGLFERYQQALAKRGKATARMMGSQRGVGMFGRLLLLWAGAWMVLGGRMSLGDMLAASSVALAVLAPMESFSGAGQLYHSVRAQVERLFDVLDTKVEENGTVQLPPHRPNRITLRDVTYRYGSRQAPALANVSLELPPGHKLGVVGRTGSGKSTLGLLLLGLLRPEHGQVLHDGVTLADLDLADLRSHTGAVLQELSLFQGTIRENLTLTRPDATATEVIEAATLAGLHDDVVALPLGYETPVGQGGTALSSGQRQRVALARALVHRPRLLLLDEATSNLDPETERRVDEALGALEVTRVVISHRVNAVRNADLIVALERGRVVQRGTHDDLLAVPGVYRDLFGEHRRVDEPALGLPLLERSH
jgi:ABC-type bacteriocin/lantibiotic exporter with double-glycine peptidase domain